jgi:hypothetical protein
MKDRSDRFKYGVTECDLARFQPMSFRLLSSSAAAESAASLAAIPAVLTLAKKFGPRHDRFAGMRELSMCRVIFVVRQPDHEIRGLRRQLQVINAPFAYHC